MPAWTEAQEHDLSPIPFPATTQEVSLYMKLREDSDRQGNKFFFDYSVEPGISVLKFCDLVMEVYSQNWGVFKSMMRFCNEEKDHQKREWYLPKVRDFGKAVAQDADLLKRLGVKVEWE